MDNYVPSTELKSKLSEYLRLVESGKSFLVTLRGAPIARIGPVNREGAVNDAIEYMDKVQKGAPRLSSKKLKIMLHEDQK